MPKPVTKQQKSINFCLYADPGSGKTGFLGSHDKPVLIADADPGTETIASLNGTADVEVCEDFADLHELYETIKNGGFSKDYDWFWLDSGTIFQERALHDEVLPEAIAANPHRSKAGGAYVPDVREYLIVQNQLSKLIRHFVGLPINFGFTAMADLYEYGEDAEERYMPMIQGGDGKLSAKLCGYMNVVGYMRTLDDEDDEEFHNAILFRKTGKFYAKDRFDALGDMMEDPTLADVTSRIRRSLGSAGSGTKKKAARKKAAARKRRS